jgi:hypothetical protein
LLDHKLKPWLLEVNVCPSLSSSSPLDKTIKTMLLCDILHCIGFQIYDRKKLEKEQDRINKQRLLGFDAQLKKQGSSIQPSDSNLIKTLKNEPAAP